MQMHVVHKNPEIISPHCEALALSSPDLKLPIQTEKKDQQLSSYSLYVCSLPA